MLSALAMMGLSDIHVMNALKTVLNLLITAFRSYGSSGDVTSIGATPA